MKNCIHWGWLVGMVLGGLAGRPGQAAAQATLTPVRHGYVTRTGTVGATFARPLRMGARAGLRVFGGQRGGRKAGTASIAGSQLTFAPAAGFWAGELVQATLDRAYVYDSTQAPLLTQSLVWQFRGAATPSNGLLTSQTLLDWTEVPEVLAIGDLNNDGAPDVLGAYAPTGNGNTILSTRLNDGTGSFAAGAGLTVPYVVTAMTLGDVDNDGDLDLLTLGYRPDPANATGFYSVYPNQNGTLGTPTRVALGGEPADGDGLTLADLTGDGALDLVLSLRQNRIPSAFVYVNVQGAFVARALVSNLGSAAVGDVDNDGDLDLLGFDTSTSTTKLAMQLNGGTGTFTAGFSATLSGQPTGLRLADVTGDGYLDALTYQNQYPTGSTNAVQVWRSLGNRSFAAGMRLDVPRAFPGTGYELADLDGDNDLDVVAPSGTHVLRYLNDAAGTFGPTPADLDLAPRQAYGVATLDTDGDGDLDVLAATLNVNGAPRPAVQVLRNGPAAVPGFGVTAVLPAANRPAARTAPARATFSTPLGTPAAPALRATSSWGRGQAAGPIAVAGNSLTLTPTAPYLPGELVTVSVTKAVRDAAGVPLARPYVWQFVAAATGGNGQFTGGAQVVFPSSNYPLTLRLADIDGDQDLDIVTSLNNTSSSPAASRSMLLNVQRNNGRGVFGAPEPLLGQPVLVAYFEFADVDGDGDLDLLCGAAPLDVNTGTATGPVNSVWLNNGPGTFTAQGVVSSPGNTWGVGDLDGDGDVDVMNGGVRLNDGQGNFYGSGTFYQFYLRGTVLGDLDGDGDLDALTSSEATNQFYVHLNDGSGTLGAGRAINTNSFSDDLLLRDMDNDGDLDLLAPEVFPGYSFSTIWLNDGLANFTKGGSVLGFPLQAGDVDGDGDCDVMTKQGCYLNNGAGLLQAAPASQVTNSGTEHGCLGDLDGDGDLDWVAVYNYYQGDTGWIIRFNAGQALAGMAATPAPAPGAWPNPVAAGGRLGCPVAGPATLTLQTLLGQPVWTQTLAGAGSSVPVGSLAAGVYLLTVREAGRPATTQRLAVE